MTHNRFRASLDDFLSENLSASARAEMAAHLAVCASCAALKNEREADLGLSRAALGAISRRPAPPELRLRVRAAIQDEKAAVAARLAMPRSFFPARVMRASAWSGTLVLGGLALLIWARPFAQMPLGSPPQAASAPASDPASETDSGSMKQQVPAASIPNRKPISPSPLDSEKRQRKASQSPILPAQKPQNGAARPQKPAPPAHLNGSMRAAAPLPIAPRSNSVFDSTAPPIPQVATPSNPNSQRAPLPAMPRLPQVPRAVRRSEEPRALPEIAAKPSEGADRAAASATATTADSDETSAAKMTAPATAPRASFRGRNRVSPPPAQASQPAQAPQPAAESPAARPNVNSDATRDAFGSGAMTQSPAANSAANSVTEFQIEISQVPEPNQRAIFGSIPAQGSLSRSQANQSAGGAGGRGGFSGGFSGGFGGVPGSIPAVPQAVPPATRNAPTSQQFSPQQPTSPTIQRAPGFSLKTVPGGAQNAMAGNRTSVIENRVTAASLQAWTMTLVSPRAIEGAAVRVDVPPPLRVGERSAPETVFRGDLVPGRAVILRFSTRGARGGEKISIVVEQNGAGAQSKPVETRIIALPTPKS